MSDTEKNNQEKRDVKQFFKNPWKVAFITLIAILLSLVIVVGYRISTPRMTYDSKNETTVDLKDPILEVSMTKDQASRAINYYIKDLFDSSGVDYTFHLDKDALIDGTFSLLGHDTHFYLYFEPFVLANGDVQLKAKDLTVGTLSVPIPAMISYISHSVDFPKWIEINPDEQYITIHLQQMKLANGMRVKAEQINLVNDQIRFNLYLSDNKK
ncbi:YpmS family protein [Melissococcus sp. OM08-11BH]|uniref:YpmS family protein n=1 Tax=Melissococcus sp. OM08-11BH TaxID=2293110 RepID=UPI0013142316|nr:YpmS family protein [Melissococcus sp. OM08-11BH]